MQIVTTALTLSAIACTAGADIMIDDWTTGTYSETGFSNSVENGTMLGGVRRLLQQQPQPGPNNSSTVGDGQARVSRESGFQYVFWSWDNDRNGLGGIDLTEGGANDRFIIEDFYNDGRVRAYITVTDTNGNRTDYDFPSNWTNIGPQTLWIMFSDFDNGSDPFQSVDRIHLAIDIFSSGDSASEASLGAFSVGVPTPGAASALGLVGLAASRRRR